MSRFTLIALTLAIAPSLSAQSSTRLQSEIDRRAKALLQVKDFGFVKRRGTASHEQIRIT